MRYPSGALLGVPAKCHGREMVNTAFVAAVKRMKGFCCVGSKGAREMLSLTPVFVVVSSPPPGGTENEFYFFCGEGWKAILKHIAERGHLSRHLEDIYLSNVLTLYDRVAEVR